MRSLPQVLHEATRRNASEVVLEAGEAPMIRTEAGSVALGEILAEGDLFDALGQVLGPDQQAELAVGNVVEFQLASGTTRWSLITEAGTRGVIVRGHCSTRATLTAEIGIPLDLPPLEHTDSDADRAPAVRASVLSRASHRSTVLDLASPVPEDVEAEASAAEPTPVRSSGRPSWLESTDFAGDDEADPSASPENIDFELRGSGIAIEIPEDTREIGAMLEGDARSDDIPSGDTRLGEIARAITAGTLCLVRGSGIAEQLARHMGRAIVAVDAASPDSVFASARERDEETTYLVRLEDPSLRLGWMLRRLEEGGSVIVETRARTFEGARRILLGMISSPRADAWLSAHRVCWLAPHGGEWTLQR